MSPARLEAFTDGVVAIIITIMVLELKVPAGHDLAALAEAAPVFLAYVLSYINVGLFWANHHHMLHMAKQVDGRVLWTNLGLLFWLSLVPFVIRWMDETGLTALPVAAYGAVLFFSGVSYVALQWAIIRCNPTSELRNAIGKDWKGKTSMIGYGLGTVCAGLLPWLSIAIYVAIAALWLIPDRRIEKHGGGLA